LAVRARRRDLNVHGMCENVGDRGTGLPMLTSRKDDLAASPKTRTLAYWHRPIFDPEPYRNQEDESDLECSLCGEHTLFVWRHKPNSEVRNPDTPG